LHIITTTLVIILRINYSNKNKIINYELNKPGAKQTTHLFSSLDCQLMHLYLSILN